jgi:hypothetical protein
MSAFTGTCFAPHHKPSRLHKDLAKQLAYALVWGTSSKHYPQRCGASHVIDDEDVVQLVKKKSAGGAAQGAGRPPAPHQTHSTDSPPKQHTVAASGPKPAQSQTHSPRSQKYLLSEAQRPV